MIEKLVQQLLSVNIKQNDELSKISVAVGVLSNKMENYGADNSEILKKIYDLEKRVRRLENDAIRIKLIWSIGVIIVSFVVALVTKSL